MEEELDTYVVSEYEDHAEECWLWDGPGRMMLDDFEKVRQLAEKLFAEKTGLDGSELDEEVCDPEIYKQSTTSVIEAINKLNLSNKYMEIHKEYMTEFDYDEE